MTNFLKSGPLDLVHFLIFLFLGVICLKGLAQSTTTIAAASNPEQAEISIRKPNDQYHLQLVPGQAYTGKFYYGQNWSFTPLTIGWQTDNEADWLIDFTPKNLTLDFCGDPIPLKLFFKAPAIPGRYALTITDTSGTFVPLDVSITVKKQPVPIDSVSFNIDVGEIRILEDPTNEWFGLNLGCRQPFYPSDSQLFKFTTFPSETPWLSLNQDSFHVPREGVEWLTWKMQPRKAGEQFAYIVKDLEWTSWPLFYKVTLNPGQVTTSTTTYENEIAQIGQGYPNPTCGLINIPFTLEEAGPCVFKIYDLKGNTLRTIDAGFFQRGPATFRVDVSGFQSGVYYYQLICKNARPIGRAFVVVDD